MAGRSKEVADGAEHTEEMLRLCGQFESPHSRLPRASGLTRLLDPAIQSSSRPHTDALDGLEFWPSFAGCGIACKPIDDGAIGHILHPIEQVAEETLCGGSISALLHDDFGHLPVLVTGSPQVDTPTGSSVQVVTKSVVRL